MITADQLVAHAVGDYVFQSDWMANEKTKRYLPAMLHAVTYGLAFVFFRPSALAFFVIMFSHFVIDRWRLARHVCWFKNFLSPIRMGPVLPPGYRFLPGQSADSLALRNCGLGTTNPPWSMCSATGYPPDRPPWMAVWLMIVADNVMHVLINGAALRWL